MHRLSLWIAGLAVVALVAISIGVNVNFGYRIGGPFLGGLSGAIDFLKIAMPAVMVLAFTARGHAWSIRLTVIGLAAIVWIPCTFWGLQSAAGAALLFRADYAGERQATVDKRQRLAEERSKLAAKAPWSAEIQPWKDRPSQAIAREIEAYKEAKGWIATAKCTSADTPEEQRYCRTYRLMQAAQETASQAERDGVRLEQVERDLNAAPATTESDPSAKEIAALIGVDRQQIVNAWAALVAFILEFVPNVGPALLMLVGKLGKPVACQPVEPGDPIEEAALEEGIMLPHPEPAKPSNVVPLDNYRKPRVSHAPDVELVLAAAMALGSDKWTMAKLQKDVAARAGRQGTEPPGHARIGVILHQHGWVRCGRTVDSGMRSVVYERKTSRLN